MTCPTCNDNGLVIDRAAGSWDVCPKGCEPSKSLERALREGEADIKAGRLHKWSEIRKGIR